MLNSRKIMKITSPLNFETLLKFYGIFLRKNYVFSYDFDIFDGSIGCATKFHADEIYFFFETRPFSFLLHGRAH